MPRPRKSVGALKVAGTYRADRHASRREVEAAGDLTTQPLPAHLSEGEQVVWREVCRVAPPRLLKDADTFLLEAFCCAVAAHREACAAMAGSTLLVAARNGSSVVNPLAGEIRRQARLVAELGTKLVLAPAERLRLLDGTPPETEAVDADFRRLFGPPRLIRGDHA